jgi:hypothetical protein
MRVGTIMGKTFKERDFVEHEGFHILRTEIDQYIEERQREDRVKRYTITKVPAPHGVTDPKGQILLFHLN